MKCYYLIKYIYSVKFMNSNNEDDNSDISLIYEMFIAISIIMQNMLL